MKQIPNKWFAIGKTGGFHEWFLCIKLPFRKKMYAIDCDAYVYARPLLIWKMSFHSAPVDQLKIRENNHSWMSE